ncbi:GAF domain-containing protein [Nocardioides sp. QY071]|uniref:GAF domain-containing protein n=1 Tax=Nocardioides sp. QY071 TaxID=3044187 RepID=UPI00249A352B|nr:GAF domain-containing protein [Nocardioides sp. QY071]WGY04549.1 GAF domain-containing protein [Nocardioides sp. QY071]
MEDGARLRAAAVTLRGAGPDCTVSPASLRTRPVPGLTCSREGAVEATEDARRAWLLPRVDRRCAEAVERVIEFVAEHLAIATLQRFPIRAVLGVPLLVDERVVGGASVVRFSVDRPFTDQDEALVLACATRIAPMLDLRTRLSSLVDETTQP